MAGPPAESSGDAHDPRAALEAWLIDHGGARAEVMDLVERMGRGLLAAGARLLRINLSLDDFHPEVVGRTYAWHRDTGREETDRRWTPRRSGSYMDSPVRLVHAGAAAVRERLSLIDTPAFEITRELKAAGATDYAAIELPFTDGSRQFLSFASDHPEGFSQEDLRLFDRLKPFMGARLEIEYARRRTEQLLATYLGFDAARRVISGTIRRGAGEEIEAVVLACDLRGFTRLADTRPAPDVIMALGEFYEAVADPVRQIGGDIVKMIGDGILALVPLGPRSPETDRVIAERALGAVREATGRLATLPPEALPAGVEGLRAGFALHVGAVTFGNVGARERLDFTAIGPAVNEAFRLESLTKVLGVDVVVSAAFADLLPPDAARPLGFHVLRGVREPREVFAPT